MFRKTQRLYDAVYSWKDYRTEVDRLDRLIRERHPRARTLLDVACGTGKHLELLRGGYEVEGVDLDPEMLAISRDRLKDVPFHEGDMESFDIGKRFDVVTCLFSSIAYTRTAERLHRAVGAMARHLAPGGVLVVEPFFTPEAFRGDEVFGLYVDDPELKIARINVNERRDGLAILDFHYLVGTPEGVEHLTELHEIGLFTHQEHLDAFRAAGLEAEHDAEGLMGRGLYLAVAPGGRG
jgi:SAM-dependent methyltransferase